MSQNQIQPNEISQHSIEQLKSIRHDDHPRLHFNSKDIPVLQKQARTTHLIQWQNLIHTVNNHAHWEPLTDVSDEWLSHGSREVYLEEAGAMLTNVALAYVIEENPEYLERAKRWMTTMVGIPKDNLSNYGFGFYLMGLARAYDWLYPYLSETERNTVREGILKITLIMNNLLFPEDGSPRTWWGNNYLHHDAWIPFAGYGVGALVLIGEVDEALQWAIRSRQDFDIAFQLLGDDGAWLEGPADWTYAMASLLMFFEPWQRITGEDVFSIPWIQNTGWYRMYAWLPDDSYIYVNDSFRSGRYNISGSASSHILRKLAAKYQNEYFQWLGHRDEEFDLKYGPKGVKQSPYSWKDVAIEYPYPQIMCAAWNFLWYDPSVQSQTPKNLPLDRYFENQGIVFMRSSWDSSANIASFSCGPRGGHVYADAIQQGKRLSGGNIAHAHTQYNAFTLYADKYYFIVPPGYGLRDARFQNTVLVDGSGLRSSGEVAPEIKKFDSQSNYVYLVGDATNTYYPDLAVQQSYRHFIFFRPNLWLTYDHVIVDQNARPETKRFEWRVHPNKNSPINIWKDQIRISKQTPDESELHIQILEPPPLSRSVEAPGFVLENNPIYLPTGEKLLNRINASIYVGRASPAEWHNFAVIVNQDSSHFPLKATLLNGENVRGINCFQNGTNYIAAFAERTKPISYTFYSKGVKSVHLISGLENNARYSRKITPASSFGSHYYRIEIISEPNGQFQSSAEGVLYYELGRASGVREYPDVSE